MNSRKCFSLALGFHVTLTRNIRNVVLCRQTYATSRSLQGTRVCLLRSAVPWCFLSQDIYSWLSMVPSIVFLFTHLHLPMCDCGCWQQMWQLTYKAACKLPTFAHHRPKFKALFSLYITWMHTPHLMHGQYIWWCGHELMDWCNCATDYDSLGLDVTSVLYTISCWNCLELSSRKVAYCLRLQRRGESGTSFVSRGKVVATCLFQPYISTELFSSPFPVFLSCSP